MLTVEREYSPSTWGVILNKPISQLLAEGYVSCFDTTYATPTTSQNMITSCGADSSKYIFVGSKATASSVNISLGAYVLAKDAFTFTTNTRVATWRFGAYWYHTSTGSFGFSDLPNINLNTADQEFSPSSSGRRRLSWAISASTGGYRSGLSSNLNSDTNWRKVIYVYAASPPTVTPTSMPADSVILPTWSE